MWEGLMKKRVLFAAIAACALAGQAAVAQTFPTKPIRLVVPYPAGGTTDIMARALQEPLQQLLGQPVVVDNKAGAAGAIGTKEVARAPADGHTLLFSNNGPTSIVPFLQSGAGYDGVKDFAPVSLVTTAPMFVVVNAATPVKTLSEFIDHARKQPEGLHYASAGIGSFGHLTTELFAREAGLKLVHVPYRGQAPTTNAILTNEVKLLMTTASGSMNEYISGGKLKLLAVTTKEPSPLAPGAPTVAQVLPNFNIEVWFGILAPAKTPEPVVAKLNEALTKVLAEPAIKERYKTFGVIARASTPKEFEDLISEEAPRWAALIRERGIKPE